MQQRRGHMSTVFRATGASIQGGDLGRADFYMGSLSLQQQSAVAMAARWISLQRSHNTETESAQLLAPLQQAIASATPEERRTLSDCILLVPGSDSLPWAHFIPASSGLALLYNFAPFQDTGSTVASKRIRSFAQSVDVLACSFLHHKKQDPTIERISAPYVRSKYFLPFRPSWATWQSHAAFAAKAASIARRYIASRERPYEFVYSRAMWSPSLLAGALVKIAHPHIRWIAEFSDPLSRDSDGKLRGGPIEEDAVSQSLVSEFERRYGTMSGDAKTVFSLPEHIAYCLADEIIFTNENQMSSMLDWVSRDQLRDRICSVATVRHHPSLPRPYYEMESVPISVNHEHLNVAYFGEFYSSRGLAEVSSAIRTLPDYLQNRVRLHVFTNYLPEAEGGKRPRNFSHRQYAGLVQRALDGVGAQGIEHLVCFHPSLPYLQFLAATDSFDLLVVRDASTRDHHAVNPYLPSKWSDYFNSKAATWALVEEGSILSRLQPRFRSPVGDVGAARAVLWQAAEDKFGVTEVRSGGPNTQ